MLEQLKQGNIAPVVDRYLNSFQRDQKSLIYVRKENQPDGIELYNFEACLSDRDREDTHYPWTHHIIDKIDKKSSSSEVESSSSSSDIEIREERKSIGEI